MKHSASKPSPGPSRADGMQLKIQQSEQSFQGPIPPPAVLEGYERVVPGAAERILRMAEQEALHRRALEVEAMRANASAGERQLDLAQAQLKSVFASDKLGQWLGFGVSCLVWLVAYIWVPQASRGWVGCWHRCPLRV